MVACLFTSCSPCNAFPCFHHPFILLPPSYGSSSSFTFGLTAGSLKTNVSPISSLVLCCADLNLLSSYSFDPISSSFARIASRAFDRPLCSKQHSLNTSQHLDLSSPSISTRSLTPRIPQHFHLTFPRPFPRLCNNGPHREDSLRCPRGSFPGLCCSSARRSPPAQQSPCCCRR